MKATLVMVITVAGILGTVGNGFSAQVRETFQGKSGKQVYILEDIHGDAQVQMGHVKLLAQIFREKGLELVATEGATGYLSSLPLKTGSLPSSERLAAANTLLQNNRLNAAHLLQTLAGGRFTVVGVENKESYARHLEIAAVNDAARITLHHLSYFGALLFRHRVPFLGFLPPSTTTSPARVPMVSGIGSRGSSPMRAHRHSGRQSRPLYSVRFTLGRTEQAWQ